MISNILICIKIPNLIYEISTSHLIFVFDYKYMSLMFNVFLYLQICINWKYMYI